MKDKTSFVKVGKTKKGKPYSDNAAELELGDISIDAPIEVDYGNAASTTDCTGIIQVPPEDDAEYEAYNEVYSFAPGNTAARDGGQTDGRRRDSGQKGGKNV